MSAERGPEDVGEGAGTDLRDAIEAAARAVGAAAKASGRRVTAAESCTGGLVCAALTGVPGISASFERGYVTYANAAKTGMLGVPADLIARHGAVSAAVAGAMARGALARSGADVAVAVTGVAGPGGGTPDKPVGLVHFATAAAEGVVLAEERFGDIGRRAVRERSVLRALRMLAAALGAPGYSA